MECPVCYHEFDTTARKPTVLLCGHTLCIHCVAQVDRCSLCKKKINFQGDLHKLGNEARRMASKGELVPKTNYALLEVIEKNQDKARTFGICEKTKLPEEMLCVDCKLFVCLGCIDKEHSNHSFKKPGHKMTKMNKDAINLKEEISKQLQFLQTSTELFKKEKDSGDQLLESAIDSIEYNFAKIIVMINEKKDEMINTLMKAHADRMNYFKNNLEKMESISKELTSLKWSLAMIRTSAKNKLYELDQKLIDEFVNLNVKTDKARNEFSTIPTEDDLKNYPSLPNSQNFFDSLQKLLALKQQEPLPTIQVIPADTDNHHSNLSLTFDAREEPEDSLPILSNRSDRSIDRSYQERRL